MAIIEPGRIPLSGSMKRHYFQVKMLVLLICTFGISTYLISCRVGVISVYKLLKLINSIILRKIEIIFATSSSCSYSFCISWCQRAGRRYKKSVKNPGLCRPENELATRGLSQRFFFVISFLALPPLPISTTTWILLTYSLRNSAKLHGPGFRNSMISVRSVE